MKRTNLCCSHKAKRTSTKRRGHTHLSEPVGVIFGAKPQQPHIRQDRRDYLLKMATSSAEVAWQTLFSICSSPRLVNRKAHKGWIHQDPGERGGGGRGGRESGGVGALRKRADREGKRRAELMVCNQNTNRLHWAPLPYLKRLPKQESGLCTWQFTKCCAFENKRLTVKERNKLHSERSCFVLLPAPLHCTQLLPGREKKTPQSEEQFLGKSAQFRF